MARATNTANSFSNFYHDGSASGNFLHGRAISGEFFIILKIESIFRDIDLVFKNCDFSVALEGREKTHRLIVLIGARDWATILNIFIYVGYKYIIYRQLKKAIN